MTLHIFHHSIICPPDNTNSAKATLLAEILSNQTKIMTDLSRLQTATATINTSIDAAVAQINKLSVPSDDQPAIDAATSALNASNDKLVAATNASISPVPAA